MNPPINFFASATATPDRFSSFLVADVRCASAAGCRDNANTASDKQRRSTRRHRFASGGTTTRPQLTDNETTFAERQQLREQRLQRQLQRQFTRDWQSALEALAALLPRTCPGLTTISWQQGTLEIKGLTTSITALNALETSLRQMHLFISISGGATQQDAQGRWQFEYQLTRKVSDGHAL